MQKRQIYLLNLERIVNAATYELFVSGKQLSKADLEKWEPQGMRVFIFPSSPPHCHSPLLSSSPPLPLSLTSSLPL